MDYAKDLADAVERTKKWIGASPACAMAARYLSDDYFKNVKPTREVLLAHHAQQGLPLQAHVGACIQVNVYTLMDFYRLDLPLVPVLTAGDVIVERVPRYQVSRQGLRRLIREGRSGTGTVYLHAWLTWPDLTIQDLTVLPSLVNDGYLEPSATREGSILLGQPEELAPRFAYRPWLVGADLVWRIAAMPPSDEDAYRREEDAWMQRRRAAIRRT